MSAKGFKQSTGVAPHKFTGASMSQSSMKHNKKKGMLPYQQLGSDHKHASNDNTQFYKKRKNTEFEYTDSRKRLQSKQHKSKHFSESDISDKKISNEESYSKSRSRTFTKSNSDDSSEDDTDESDDDEMYGDEDEGAYGAVSGTSRMLQGSAGEAVSDDDVDDNAEEEEEEEEEEDSDVVSDEDDNGEEGGTVQDDGDEDGGTDQHSDEYDAIKKELSNIPLEDLMKIKERVGLKVFNKIMHGDRGDKGEIGQRGHKGKKSFKRENKNRPREMSSKRQVPILRHMDHVSKKHEFHRDPRFDDLSGEYKDEYFEKNYSFLNDIKDKEKKIVKKKLKKTTDSTKKKDLQGLLMRMKQQDQVRENKQKRKAVEAAWKSKEKEQVKDGKLPYFLKKSEKKKLELAEKYRELQKSGKLEQYLTKKRKKNAAKERKKLPQQMNDRS